jgi:hypothetical protein
VNERSRFAVVVSLGVIGGLGVVSMASKGLKEGVADEERRGLLIAAAVGLGGYAAAKLWNLEKEWWFSPEEAAKKARKAAVEAWQSR